MSNLLAGLADVDHNTVDAILFTLVGASVWINRLLVGDLLKRNKALEAENAILRARLGTKAKGSIVNDDSLED